VDARDAWMRTPLHFAAVYGFGETNPSTVTALYHAGANSALPYPILPSSTRPQILSRV
jgi:hypothetical protein